MTECTFDLETLEDMALGTLGDGKRADVEEHVARCDACRAALGTFAEEVALFDRRRAVIAHPPTQVLETPRRDFRERAARAAIGALACAAALALMGRSPQVVVPNDDGPAISRSADDARGGFSSIGSLACIAPARDVTEASTVEGFVLASFAPQNASAPNDLRMCVANVTSSRERP